MQLYSENKDYKLYQGNMLDMLDVIELNSIDSIITDPPYELNFMGKGWDNSGIAFKKETWEKCYEVLKAGGYLLAFGGSRTFHRIACAIEDAGFEIRDTIMWLYGSGFPKSLNIGLAIDKKKGVESKAIGKTLAHGYSNVMKGGQYEKGNSEKYVDIKEAQNEWQGWGTALKPSFEPIIVARKPFKGSLVDNVIEYGVGGINIDECRVGEIGGVKKVNIEPNSGSKNSGFGCNGKLEELNKGRFPANTILTYDETDYDEVCGEFPYTKGGNRHNTVIRLEDSTSYGGKAGSFNTRNEFNDSGSASRYFYCAKASKKDRDEGLDEFEEKGAKELLNREENSKGASWNGEYSSGNAYAGAGCPKKNTHPTVKPTELMQYLVRLVSPDGATILDCFNGSGSTGKAVMYENKERNKNYKYIGIELTPEYLPIAKARIEFVCNLTQEELKEQQMTIFDYLSLKSEVKMEEMTIEELTKLFIKEDFEERKQKKYYKITKKEMINLCLKVVKLMESVKNG